MATETRAVNGGELRFMMDQGRARVDGRAILFDSWSVDLGGFKERMLPGSVQLEADLVALFDHDTSKVLGRTSAGTMEVTTDSRGVAFTSYPPDTTWARDLRVSMERGDIRGCSYRMMVQEDKWYMDETGQVCRDVLKATVSELTITSMPAYPETTAEARSHAKALAAAAGSQDRAGRVLSDANEVALKAALGALELAEDTIEAVLMQVDPTFKAEDTAEDESECECCNGEGCPGCTCGTEGEGSTDAGCTCPDENCATCNPTDSGSMDGASSSSRSSDGASETQKNRSQTFVPGFGFIPNRKEK